MLTVKERGHFVATMRYVHVWLMETLAAWVPTTPEMEVKLLFGEHIWDVAQHADSLGKRTFELRLPLQHSVRPAEPYVEFLAEMAAIGPTPRAPGGHVRRGRAGLWQRQRRYLEQTDKLVGCADRAHPGALPGRHRPDDRRGPRAAPGAAGAADWPIATGSPPSQAREASLELLAAAPAGTAAVGA